MNFFDCAKVTIKRADDGGYMVSLACGGVERSAVFLDYEHLQEWLDGQICEFEQRQHGHSIAADEAPPLPDIPLPPDARWCRDPAGGWVLVDDRGHIHVTHDEAP